MTNPTTTPTTNEPGSLVLTLFDRLVDRIKSTRPVRTDGKSLTTGFVYSQLILGMPINPRDYMNPWSPMGGTTLQETVSTTADGSGTAPRSDAKFRRAIEAAFKTSQLVDTMLMVTNDDSYLQYPTGRHVSFAYENIINGMQATPTPPIAPEVQKQIDDARKVLYEQELDDDGNLTIIGKSKLYKRYVKNATAYAEAKKIFAEAQAAALADPIKAESWPLTSTFYQRQVDEAWDTFKGEGAEKVERALDIIESAGVSMQNRMIAKARKIYDAWNLGLAGVPVATPYSYISPSSWCNPEADAEDGWTKLTIGHSEYHNRDTSHAEDGRDEHSESNGSLTTVTGNVSLGFVNLIGGGGAGSIDTSSQGNWRYASQNSFHNDAHNLTIELEYALCTVNRPWALFDTYYMQNWYLVNNRKNAISDGSIDTQVRNEKPLLPMVPTQFLAIRNVKISAEDWGSDGQMIQSIVGNTSSSGNTSSATGTGGVSLGFITVAGSHGQSHTEGDSQSSGDDEFESEFGAHWDGQTLEIKGTQIIAWLSEMMPACPPLDDPGLVNPTND